MPFSLQLAAEQAILGKPCVSPNEQQPWHRSLLLVNQEVATPFCLQCGQGACSSEAKDHANLRIGYNTCKELLLCTSSRPNISKAASHLWLPHTWVPCQTTHSVCSMGTHAGLEHMCEATLIITCVEQSATIRTNIKLPSQTHMNAVQLLMLTSH